MKKTRNTIQAIGIIFSGLILFSLIFAACILPDIGETNLTDRLQKFKFVTVDFNADIKTNSEFLDFSGLYVDNIPYESNSNCELDWNGNDFTANFDYTYLKLATEENVRNYGQVTGKLSEDGETIESLTIDHTSLTIETGDVFKDFITVINVPYDSDYEYDSYTPRFSVEGYDVRNHVYSFSQSWEFSDSDGNKVTIYSTNVYYDNPDDEPFLRITFSEN